MVARNATDNKTVENILCIALIFTFEVEKGFRLNDSNVRCLTETVLVANRQDGIIG